VTENREDDRCHKEDLILPKEVKKGIHNFLQQIIARVDKNGPKK